MTVTEPAPLPTRRENPFDPPPELRLLRADRPVSRLFWCPELNRGSMRTRRTSSARVTSQPSPPPGKLSPERAIPKDMRVTLPGLFIQMDPPEHTRYRRALTAQFTVARMRAMRARITEIVSEYLDAMDKAGSPADLVAAFARPIPLLVICELLGVPAGPRAEFVRNTDVVGNRDSSPEALRAAVEGNRAAMREVIRDKRDEPDAGLISALVHEEEARFTEDELVSIGLLLLVNGNESTANMLGLGVFALLEHPDQVGLLRVDPTRWAGAVEELLRYLTVLQYGIVRIATAEVQLAGQHILPGDPVVLSLAAANRDPAQYDAPDTLDVLRPTVSHLAFGYGVHQCIGQHHARAEMQIAYRALFDRFPAMRLDVARHDVRLRSDMNLYGVRELPVPMDGLTGLFVTTDAAVCCGSGVCVMYAPEVFNKDERDGTVIVLVSRPTDALWPAVRTAAERCPTQAIGVAHLGRE